MKTRMIWLMLLAFPVYGRVADFSRYEVILNRRPFGEPPPETPAAGALPVMTGPSFADSLRMVALTDSQGDVRVGFVDTKASPSKTYFLFVGESQDGIEVVSASYEEETVVLRKEGDERVLSMAHGGRVVTAGVPMPGGGMATGARPTRLQRVEGDAGQGRTPRTLSPGRLSRLAEEQRRAVTLPELHGAVLERHLQEYNVQAIRAGIPPLPIPLTEAQDAQLVAEGILPPLE